MKYSVFKKSLGRYYIYESNSPPIPKMKNLSGFDLGAVPEDSVESLPPDAKKVDESEIASGKIVDGPDSYSLKQIFVYAGIFFAIRLILSKIK